MRVRVRVRVRVCVHVCVHVPSSLCLFVSHSHLFPISLSLTLFFTTAGIICGWCSDYVGGRRATVIVAFMCLLCPLLLLFAYSIDRLQVHTISLCVCRLVHVHFLAFTNTLLPYNHTLRYTPSSYYLALWACWWEGLTTSSPAPCVWTWPKMQVQVQLCRVSAVATVA